MPYLYINLFKQRGQGQLEPDEVIVRLQELFPEAIVRPGDQLALTAQRAEQHPDQANAAHRTVVEKLRWDAQNLGPAYAFYIPAGPEPRVEGVIKRFQADFWSEGPMSHALRDRIVAFLRSLIPDGLPIDVCEEPDEEDGPRDSPNKQTHAAPRG